MKYTPLILMSLSLVLFTSCSNYNNFSSRKYTKGKFRPKVAKMKSSKTETDNRLAEVKISEALEKHFEIEEEKVGNRHIEASQTQIEGSSMKDGNSDEISNNVEFTPSSEIKFVSDNKEEMASGIETSSLSIGTRQEKAPKWKRAEKSLDEKRLGVARTLGWIAMIGSAALILAAILMSAFGGFIGFGAILMGRRVFMLLAAFGLFKGIFFYNTAAMSERAQKRRRSAIFISFATLLFWILMMV